MYSDLALGVITIVGVLLIFAGVMILKQTISLQDNIIAALRKELSELQNLYHNKQLEITRVAADNAVLKQRVIKLESHIDTDKHVIESAIKFGLKIEINYEERSSFLDLQPLLDKIKSGELDAYYNKGKELSSKIDYKNITKESYSGVKFDMNIHDEMGCVPQNAFKTYPLFNEKNTKSGNVIPLDLKSEKKTDDIIDNIRKNITKKKPTKKKKSAKKLQGKGNINKKG